MDVISSYYTVDGKQYAMPFNVSTPMLYYNKDVFEAAGLDPETPPTTYDEVLEDCQEDRRERSSSGWLFTGYLRMVL